MCRKKGHVITCHFRTLEDQGGPLPKEPIKAAYKLLHSGIESPLNSEGGSFHWYHKVVYQVPDTQVHLKNKHTNPSH